MRFYIGLILLSACINLSWADDFKLSFSQDIINAADRQPNGLDGLALPAPEKQDTPIPIPPSEVKPIEPQEPKADEVERKQEIPPLREHSRLRVHSTHVKPVEPLDNFLPIQGESASGFFGQGALNNILAWEHDSRHAGGQDQIAVDPFEQLHDEMRLMVGEDMYAKMVWAYLDAKQLDNWIYTTINQSGVFAQNSLIVELNDYLMASLTSLGWAEPNEQNFSFERQRASHQGGEQANKVNDDQQALNDVVTTANFEKQSRFLGILKFMTLQNFLFLAIFIMAAMYTGKLFKFLIRQQ